MGGIKVVNKKKSFVKTISMGLVVAMITTMFSSFPSLALGADNLAVDNKEWKPTLEETSKSYEGDLSLQDLATKTLSQEDKPEVVSEQAIA